MPFQSQVVFPDFGPIPFYIRAGHSLALNLFGIQMPAAASCTSNHYFLYNTSVPGSGFNVQGLLEIDFLNFIRHCFICWPLSPFGLNMEFNPIDA
jgi:hypothetical protein